VRTLSAFMHASWRSPATFLLCSLFLGAHPTLLGCGGDQGKQFRVPPARGPVQPEVADRDADGIPDKLDACPGGGGDDGCAQADSAPQSKTLLGAPPPPPPAPPKPGEPSPAPASGPNAAPKDKPVVAAEARDQQFLVYTAHLTLAVYQVEQGLAAVEKAARELGGFLASRNDREIVIRVPRAKFDEAVKRVEQSGDVIHRDVQAQDITEEFTDLEVRLKNARTMRDRLEELLKKAAVKDALEIEKELGRVTQEIERMEGRLKYLRDRLAYSTITVTFNARGATLESRPLRLPFPWLQHMGLPALLRLQEGK